jgi:ABC-type glycerol-3-phosphate transport system substrate-binding protein
MGGDEGRTEVNGAAPVPDIESIDPSGALVIYWHPLKGSERDYLLQMIDDFNAQNPWDITVVGEFQGDPDTLGQRILTGASVNQLPTLVMAQPGQVANYAAAQIAVDLAPYLGSKSWGFSQTELNDFYPVALDGERLPQFENRLFSFPCCRSLQVLYFNVDWLKELGYDEPPDTWETFREIACAASNPAEGLFGFEMGMAGHIFTSLLAAQDIPLLDETATSYTLGEAQGRSALEFLDDLINDGCAVWETDEGQLADLSAGSILFAVDSTMELNRYLRAVNEESGFDLAVAPLPHSTEQPVVEVRGFSNVILQSEPKEQLAAWLFIQWLAEPAQQARWAGYRVCFPTRRSTFEELGTYLEENPLYGQAARLLEEEWVTEPPVTGYSDCRAEIDRMLYAVTAGEDVAQWLASTRAYCNQTLSPTPR